MSAYVFTIHHMLCNHLAHAVHFDNFYISRVRNRGSKFLFLRSSWHFMNSSGSNSFSMWLMWLALPVFKVNHNVFFAYSPILSGSINMLQFTHRNPLTGGDVQYQWRIKPNSRIAISNRFFF